MVAILSPTLPISTSVKSCGKEWHRIKKQSGTPPTETPHEFTYAQVIMNIVQSPDFAKATDDADLEAAKNIVREHDEKLTTKTLKHAIVHCVVGETYEREGQDRKVKVTMTPTISAQAECQALLTCMAKLFKADVKTGAPPKSKHERAVIAGLIALGEFTELQTGSDAQ